MIRKRERLGSGFSLCTEGSMAQKPLRPCRHAGCGVLTRDGWCEKHRPKHRRTLSEHWHGWYSLPIWTKRLRPQQLMKEPFCRECAKAGRRTQAEVVDHVKPHRGDWNLFVDETNLQSLCKYHHDQKTAMEQAEGHQER